MRYTKLNNLVDELIKEHVGGQQFFSALDESLRKDSSYFDILVLRAHEEHIVGTVDIIVSGGFGMAFSNWLSSSCYSDNIKVILVPGGLRHDSTLLKDDIFIGDRHYIFLDDSYYSGATRDVIKAKIEEKGGKLLQTIVVYDGSKDRNPYVSSLYRYHP